MLQFGSLVKREFTLCEDARIVAAVAAIVATVATAERIARRFPTTPTYRAFTARLTGVAIRALRIPIAVASTVAGCAGIAITLRVTA